MNIGFSQAGQLTKNQKRRLEMVNYAEENGINAATKKFGTTNKTVNLWINRYHQEGIAGLVDRTRQNIQNPATCSNRTKSRLTVIKPRNKASFLSTVSTNPEDKRIIPEPVEFIEEIIQKRPIVLESKKEIAIDKRLPSTISPQYSDADIKTIQVGFLNLNDIDGFGDICKKYNLPSWQFTAFDPETGGAWITYSFEIDRDRQNEFLKALSKHLTSHGILPDQINFELCYNSTILKKPEQIDTAKTEKSLEPYFLGRVTVQSDLSEHGSRLNRFHRLLEDKFYLSVRVSTVSKLLEKAESFIIQYNYKKNFKAPLNLPPNQLICRQFGNNFGPGILKFKPLVLMGNQAGGARYLVGLRMMAGLLASIAGTILSRKKRIRNAGKIRSTKIIKKVNIAKTKISKLLISNVGIETPPQVQQNAEPVDHRSEYINLKNMNWEKPLQRQTETDIRRSKVRNRQELINRAKKLLAQKRSIAELKKTLPMTEGELSMLSQNITFSDTERN